MNSALLTLLVIATGSAAWSAAEFGMAPGEQPAPVPAKPVAATPLEIGPQGCIVRARQRIVLRAPSVERLGLPTAEHARAERAVLEDWRQEMSAAGVPQDLLDRTLRMPNRAYELSAQETLRLGCVVE